MTRPPRILTSLAAALVLLIPALARAQQGTDSTAASAATASPPWVPAEPVPSARTWEHVVRAPGKVVSLPFSLLGLGIKGGLVLVEESELIPKVQAHLMVAERAGIFAGPASLGDRTGWGGEVSLNPPIFRSFVASVSGATRGYNRGRLALESTKGMVEYQSNWRSRDSFFGIGPDASDEDASNYASQSQSARVQLRWPFRREVTKEFELLEDPAVRNDVRLPLRKSVRAWVGSRDVVELDGRERTDDRLPLSERFPGLAAGRLGTRVEHFLYGIEGSLDHRSGRPHWWRGWRLLSSVERFQEPVEALAFHSASTPSVEFTRWNHEGEAAWSFWRDPRTFRLFLRAQDIRDAGDEGVFLLGDLSTLGGSQGLSGFEAGRFHDLDLVLGRLSYIFPLARYIEGELIAEAGQVVPALEDARLADLETSYGTMIRFRTSNAPFLALGVHWSVESVRFKFKLGGIE